MVVHVSNGFLSSVEFYIVVDAYYLNSVPGCLLPPSNLSVVKNIPISVIIPNFLLKLLRIAYQTLYLCLFL